jgi:hypothetical protein
VTRAPTYNDVVAFVDSLPTVDISTIPQEDLCCPFCWGNFGAQDGCEGRDVKQVSAALQPALRSRLLYPGCREQHALP